MAELRTHGVKVILFSGKAESGKTSAAKITRRYLEDVGYKVIKLSYGDYVKQTAKMLFGWNGEKDEAGRKLLQWWGTDTVRAKNPNFWVDTVIRLISVLDSMYDFVLIDDARFVNEIDRVRDAYEAIAVRVSRPSHQNQLTSEQRGHKSETSLDNYTFDIWLSAENWSELEEQVQTVLLPRLIVLPFKAEKEAANND